MYIKEPCIYIYLFFRSETSFSSKIIIKYLHYDLDYDSICTDILLLMTILLLISTMISKCNSCAFKSMCNSLITANAHFISDSFNIVKFTILLY